MRHDQRASRQLGDQRSRELVLAGGEGEVEVDPVARADELPQAREVLKADDVEPLDNAKLGSLDSQEIDGGV